MTLHSEAFYGDGVLRLLGARPEQPPQRVRVAIELADVPGPAAPPEEDPLGDLLDWEEIARCRRDSSAAPPLEDVRMAIASIPGSMSDAVIELRQERY